MQVCSNLDATYADVCRRMPTYADVCLRMQVCSNLDAIKHIQKRGGVSAVASAGAHTVQQGISRQRQLLQQV